MEAVRYEAEGTGPPSDPDGPDTGTTPRTVRLRVEVEVGTEPVRGRIEVVGVEREFVGWTELATVIEECTHPDRR